MKALFLILFCLLLAAPGQAQTRDNLLPRSSPSALVNQSVGLTEVTITYGRPAARGRTLFGAEGSGALETYGRVWRLGANEATTITFSTDVMIEGKPLVAGTYSLFLIPQPTSATFIFNKVANQWGAFNYAEGEDALRVEVPAMAGENIEQLMFWFTDVTDRSARVMVGWGTVRAGFTITADTDAIFSARGDEAAMGEGWQLPFRYATYALVNGLPPHTALAWAERAVQLNQAYNTVALKARLQAATGAFEEAIETGEAAIALGEAMETAPRDLAALRTAVEEWRGKL